MDQELINNAKNALEFFINNFIELSILFLGLSFLIEIINLFVNPNKIKKVLSSKKSGYLIASGLGSVTPFCSCSTIPLTLGLLKAKVAFGPIMTFLFTSPLINPIILIVFWSAFGIEVTLVYASIAFFISILAGITLDKLGMEKYVKKDIFALDTCSTNSNRFKATNKNSFNATSNFKPLNNVSNFNINNNKKSKLNEIKMLSKKVWIQFSSFVHYIAIGIAIGAIIHGFVPQELLTSYASADNYFAVPIAAIIGIPLYIRASSMVGLAPALIDGGVSMGAILALTVAGAGASFPEMVMLKKIFKMPIMIFFIAVVFFMAITCGYLVNLYYSG